jgi:CheY-like chemotaxis protein
MDRLFKSFSQIDASINRRYGGTGLGLAICKRLTELMNGELNVESREGVGTTFSFWLPVGIADEVNAICEPPQTNTRRRVLVVEDNPINCVVIRRLVERLGHEVDLVTDGDSAVQRVQDSLCDLVLMDVNMPGLDGLEATRRIRKLMGPSANIPVLALTASSLADDREACMQAGMNDYLSKPISLDALRDAIDLWTDSNCGMQAEAPAA